MVGKRLTTIGSWHTIVMIVALLLALGCSDAVSGDDAGGGFNLSEGGDVGTDSGGEPGSNAVNHDAGIDDTGQPSTDAGSEGDVGTDPPELCDDDPDCDGDWYCGNDGVCVAPTCDDGLISGDQTDVDCGGSLCPPCDDGEGCEDDADCESEVCDQGQCLVPTCDDGVHNGEESDVDCGGPHCPPCEPEQQCLNDTDCVSFDCEDGLCGEIEEVVPDPPTDVVAGIGDGKLYVSWKAPAYYGTAPLLDYRVTVFDENGDDPSGVEGETNRMVGSPTTILTFDGLSNGTAYRFGVEAENTNGFSEMSELSDYVVPEATETFVTVWNTQLDGATGFDQIRLPLEVSGTYDFVVDWGDGTQDTITDANQAAVTHTYDPPGTYTVTITGTLQGWRFAGTGDAAKLIDVQQWGDLQLGNNGAYFQGARNLEITATDLPDLTGTTNFARAFQGCENLEGVPLMNHWDMSSVTDMRQMFYQAELFNEDLSAWDTSKVGHMGQMFREASHFNQDIGGWDTSSVINMQQMFHSAVLFNQDIGGWDTSKVTDMSSFFWALSEFDQDLSNWNTSSLEDANAMFFEANSFNSDISGWDTSKVKDFAGMFSLATSFNQDLSGWDTSAGETFEVMFNQALAFDQNLGSWDMTSATNVYEMFRLASLSTANYDALLNGWAQQDVQEGLQFSAGLSTYSSAAAEAREILTEEKGWQISDGGLGN